MLLPQACLSTSELCFALSQLPGDEGVPKLIDVADYFRKNHLTFTPVVIERLEEELKRIRADKAVLSTSLDRVKPGAGVTRYEPAFKLAQRVLADAGANLHARVLYGRSNHHKIESLFKAFARAVRAACWKDKRMAQFIPSTKGVL